MQMPVTDEETISRFPVGYYPLHPNVSLNFQMNRFYGWVGEEKMLDEMRAAAPRISSYDDWTREMLKLSDEALAAGRKLSAAYYSRGAQFFLDPGDPRFKPALQPFLDNVEAGNGVTADDHHLIPYQQGQLSAYRFTLDRPRSVRRAAWLRHGRPTCITPARPSTAGWTASHDAVVLRPDGLRHGQDVPPITESQQRAATDTPHPEPSRGDAGLAMTAGAGSLPGKERSR